MFLEILAQSEGAVPNDLWRLGVIAVAMLVGAAGVYKFGLVPERRRGEKLESQVATFQSVMIEKVVPALVVANQIADRAAERSDERRIDSRRTNRER